MNGSLHARTWGTLVVAAALLAGCTARPAAAPAPAPVAVPYATSVDQVWTATLAALSNANIAISSLEQASGFIRTAELVVPENGSVGPYHIAHVANCGRTGSGTPRTFNGTTFVALTVLLEPSAEGTTARIHSSMRNQSNGKHTTVNPCVSRGLLEQYIAGRIAEQIRG